MMVFVKVIELVIFKLAAFKSINNLSNIFYPN